MANHNGGGEENRKIDARGRVNNDVFCVFACVALSEIR